MSKTLAIALFLGLLLAGVAMGIARDLYSLKRGETSGEVVEVIASSQDYKSPAISTPFLKARLADGRTVDIAITNPQRFKAGDTVSLVEMVMPWGQVWYKLNKE